MMDYYEFLQHKSQLSEYSGFDPIEVHDFLFDFQKELVDWSVRKGKAAIFADCGLGKCPMSLSWANNVVRKTNKKVLIIAPLAVSHQFVAEGKKFGIECNRSIDGKPSGDITVTNYERLHLFDRSDYAGCVCDESSILKNFDGKRRGIITEFLRHMPYRLLCTATAAPNDYIELGTSSEALGELGMMDMLTRFFKNEQNTIDTKRTWAAHGGGAQKWMFKQHAKEHFWRWVCSWARAVRRPSDLGFDDDIFILPELIENQYVVKAPKPLKRGFFIRQAVGLKEQREELKRTITERCEKAAALVKSNTIAVVWCHLNAEGDLLEEMIPDAVQVAGSDSDNVKEERLKAFSDGEVRVLISKPRIAGFGLNWQHCSHMTFFPSHSFEQYYQAVRRCWRFGQKSPVTVDVITTESGVSVLNNLQRKAKAADKMFTELVQHMNDSMQIDPSREFTTLMEVPKWL